MGLWINSRNLKKISCNRYHNILGFLVLNNFYKIIDFVT
jgi:hypothetical protein